jgi:hypothetical protein
MKLPNKKPDITAVYLFGGLGNQLFQIANGLAKRKSGDQLTLLYDRDSTRINSNGLPEASTYISNCGAEVMFTEVQLFGPNRRILNLAIRISTGHDLLMGIGWFGRGLRIVVEKLLSVIFNRSYSVCIADNVGGFENSKRGSSQLFIGYAQCSEYAVKLKELLGNKMPISGSLSSKAEALISQCKLSRPIIVHVRLGDYSNEPMFGLLSRDYFLGALGLFSSEIRSREVWVFSNNLVDAKELLGQDFATNFLFINDEELTSTEVLETMRHGSGFVISNSTFSWWAAYLAHDVNAQVIAPQKWYKKYPTPKGIYPSSWVRFCPQNSLFRG